MNEGKLHRLALAFEFVSEPRISLSADLGEEFIAPSEDEPPRRIDFEDFAAVADRQVSSHARMHRASIRILDTFRTRIGG